MKREKVMERNIEARILVKSHRVKGKIEFELETKYKKDKGITFKNQRRTTIST